MVSCQQVLTQLQNLLNMNQQPSSAFVAASWVALGIGIVGYLMGLWNAEMALNEKDIILPFLMYGLFCDFITKSVRDKLENIPVTAIYYGLSWFQPF